MVGTEDISRHAPSREGGEMKLKRIAAMPFALLADAISCGNIGGNRSFTQQVFDAEKRERETAEAIELLKILLRQEAK